MPVGSYKQADRKPSQGHLRETPRYAWKERTYVVPSPSRKGFQWKASALRNIQRLGNPALTGHPVSVVVPAVYTSRPAEALALVWFTEIDAFGTIRHRILDSRNSQGGTFSRFTRATI